jgi:ADP-heptose:LPS heptosyltransferase
MRYDVALIASEEPEAYRLAAGLPERVGFVTGWAKPIKTLWVRRQLTRAIFRRASLSDADGHEVETLYRLGGALVGDGASSRDPQALRTILQGAAPAPARGGIVLQLGTKWTALGVPAERVRAIATALAAHGARAIVSPAEADAARALAGDVPLEVLPSLAAWKNAIDGAAVVVSPDTGAVHLAGMLGVPVVAVFGAERAAAQIARWRPWASPGIAFTSDDLHHADARGRVIAAALAQLHG